MHTGPALSPTDEANRSYYGKALDLLADQLAVLPAEEWEGRRWKVVAILRNAAADTAERPS